MRSGSVIVSFCADAAYSLTLAFTLSPSSITLRFVRCSTSSTDFFRKRVFPILLSCSVLVKSRPITPFSYRPL